MNVKDVISHFINKTISEVQARITEIKSFSNLSICDSWPESLHGSIVVIPEQSWYVLHQFIFILSGRTLTIRITPHGYTSHPTKFRMRKKQKLSKTNFESKTFFSAFQNINII